MTVWWVSTCLHACTLSLSGIKMQCACLWRCEYDLQSYFIVLYIWCVLLLKIYNVLIPSCRFNYEHRPVYCMQQLWQKGVGKFLRVSSVLFVKLILELLSSCILISKNIQKTRMFLNLWKVTVFAFDINVLLHFFWVWRLICRSHIKWEFYDQLNKEDWTAKVIHISCIFT